MTKDEMKQEAKEFIDNRYKHEILGKRVQEFFTFWELLCSIVDFAEPREKRIAELENEISILLSCNNCPENKGGYICQKEYEDKCLTQKIQYIKELQEENAELNKKLSKAGRPEWHKVADGDLPPTSGEMHAERYPILVCTKNGYVTVAIRRKHGRAYEWFCSDYDGNTLYLDKEVIAWCEIPKYTEE